MNLKNIKTWNLIGIVLGLVFILIGIAFIANPPMAYYTNTPDEASFGADFYTYQYGATRDVAMNAATTANNIRELGSMLAIYNGSAFILIGTLVIYYYSRKYFLENENSSPLTSSPQDSNIKKSVNTTENEATLEVE